MERLLKKDPKLASNEMESDESKRKLPRVAKRRIKIRKLILDIATKRFALEGPENVRLEDVADEADISRATLYSHFPSKDAIIYEIIKPVLEELIKEYEKLLKDIDNLKVEQIFNQLVDIYINLWENYELALILAQKVLDMEPGELKPLYERMLELKLKILSKLEKEKKLRLPKEIAFNVLLNTLIPLLRYILPNQDGKKLFRSTLKGLLMG
jgi:AcrR family transcriptional regulator